MEVKRVLILGAGGMLGNAMFQFFCQRPEYAVYGTSRGDISKLYRVPHNGQVLTNIDVDKIDDLVRLFNDIRPSVVINCVGLVKQREASQSALVAIPLNSLLPHRLAELAGLAGARLVHISTDCVFSGKKGGYTEDDQPDCYDLYGKTKLLGEVLDSRNITIRTSIIGHELSTNHSLVDWFLSQKAMVKGYKNAIFSGLPTNILASIIHEYIIPNENLTGLWHVSSDPIDKYNLLNILKKEYAVDTQILPDFDLKIDRTLNSKRFRDATGWTPPKWEELIRSMRIFHKK
jgi:dTDP-4-dehydrorhamnose reductase